MLAIDVAVENGSRSTVADRRRRVAYVVCRFEAGGLERCAAYLADRLDRSRFEPSIICLDRSGSAAGWVTAGNVPIFELRKRAGNDPFVVRRLVRLLRDQRIDLVQSHNWGTLLETCLACHASGAIHVHAEHGQELTAMRIERLKRRVHGTVRRWAFRHTAATVACAESVRARLHREWGHPLEEIDFLPNGVEAPRPIRSDARRVLRDSLGIPTDAVVIGSVGRLAPVKSFETAVAAVAALPEGERTVHLVIVGEGPEREKIESEISRTGLSGRIHLVGKRDDIGDWLATFDIFVNSSLSEAMSLSILEAMSVGLPVVATDVGDTASLIGGASPSGTLVSPGDPQALAAALDVQIRSPSIRVALGRQGRLRYLRHYTVDRMVARYAALYKQLLTPTGCQDLFQTRNHSIDAAALT